MPVQQDKNRIETTHAGNLPRRHAVARTEKIVRVAIGGEGV
jgi:hypothetical protein